MRVIVTGGAGFIGGETVLKLLNQGHSVYAIDLVMPTTNLLNCGAKWHTGDFAEDIALDSIAHFRSDAIIHCAGTSLVGPSVLNPREYYDNNFVKTKRLVDYLIDSKINTRFIFSSSAATYGEPIMTPCQEVDPAAPISPYGESKLMIEWMLNSYRTAYAFDSVSFRYFNACGADSQGRHGQAPGATHIIARVLEAMRDGQLFTLNGTDYPTDDGTCVRDYIHVEDLANAHIRAMDISIPGGTYNLGTTNGTSNAEIIDTARTITNRPIQVVIGAQRPGDPAVLTADPTKFRDISQWQPKFNLTDIIQHAWTWYNQ
jgi:UDP-glucose 4-epimerase